MCVVEAGSSNGKHQGAAGVFMAVAWTGASSACVKEWKTQFLSILPSTIPSPKKLYLEATEKFILSSNWPIFLDWLLGFSEICSFVFGLVTYPPRWRIVEVKIKVLANSCDWSKCLLWFETISFYFFVLLSIFFSSKMPKECIATVGTHTNLSCMHGEKYPF